MPALLFAAACLVLLMLQRDLGTALIYYLTTLVLFYVACGNVPLTVIGMGGVSSAQDVIEMMMAGAKAVQVGAANLVDPYACKKIIDDLPREMERLGIERLSDIQRV